MFASKQKSPAIAGRAVIFFVARTCEISNRKILQGIYKVIDLMENV
jgi:hypothetical protein